MLIDLNNIPEMKIFSMNGGNGYISAKMTANETGRFIISHIPPCSSIGMHEQTSGNDINYIISGTGKAICDGVEEELKAGVCHVCPKGHSHSIINIGNEDLVIFTVVT